MTFGRLIVCLFVCVYLLILNGLAPLANAQQPFMKYSDFKVDFESNSPRFHEDFFASWSPKHSLSRTLLHFGLWQDLESEEGASFGIGYRMPSALGPAFGVNAHLDWESREEGAKSPTEWQTAFGLEAMGEGYHLGANLYLPLRKSSKAKAGGRLTFEGNRPFFQQEQEISYITLELASRIQLWALKGFTLYAQNRAYMARAYESEAPKVYGAENGLRLESSHLKLLGAPVENFWVEARQRLSFDGHTSFHQDDVQALVGFRIALAPHYPKSLAPAQKKSIWQNKPEHLSSTYLDRPFLRNPQIVRKTLPLGEKESLLDPFTGREIATAVVMPKNLSPAVMSTIMKQAKQNLPQGGLAVILFQPGVYPLKGEPLSVPGDILLIGHGADYPLISSKSGSITSFFQPADKDNPTTLIQRGSAPIVLLDGNAIHLHGLRLKGHKKPPLPSTFYNGIVAERPLKAITITNTHISNVVIAIVLREVQNLLVHSNHLRPERGGLAVTDMLDFLPAKNIKITHNRVDTGFFGLSLGAVQNGRIANNTFQVRDFAIFQNSQKQTSNRLVFKSNTLSANLYGYYGDARGGAMRGIRFGENVFKLPEGAVGLAWRSAKVQEVSIVKNRFKGNSAVAAMVLEGDTSGITIKGNSLLGTYSEDKVVTLPVAPLP